ncbi:MAG: lysoplasmalogenase [Deltaproteobacteria bacterium]
MSINIGIIVLAALLLPILLFVETREKRKGLVPVKTSLSLLFVLTAVGQPHADPAYYALLLLGLIFCLGGDVCLALPQPSMFLMGLISFFIGHIFYAVGFFHLSSVSVWTLAITICFLFIGAGITIWLVPHLGPMKGPVLAYMGVITLMVSGAATVLGDSALPLRGRIFVFLGALCFYGSDVFVARDRFIKKQALNRLLGLPLYYTGQFLLAFSVGFVG